MHQTIYQILRDTGRRPGEAVSLRTGCIEIIGGQHNLIYDNHKAGRMRRRLPITSGTAEVITSWQQRRAQLPAPDTQRQWLFPSPLLRAHQSRGHVTPACVARAFKLWVAKIGTITSELPGPDGTPAPFEPSLITPYALRHSYAQRHADAGVPVDVLKELMDHVSVTTTMGYYQISLKRKQQAIRAVGPLATDAAGSPAPFASPTAYQRASVAVPFGNCTEPSNVKAGGGACPIRLQCAGCGFYRPDPSYLPALEQHLASLRADFETARAMDAAGYVLASLSAEIDAFAAVAQTNAPQAGRAGPRPARRGRGSQPDPAQDPRRPHPAADRHHLPSRGDGVTTTTRTRAMLTARAKDSHDKRQRALAAVQALEAAGTPVTVTAVAAAARVSTWLVYADGIREHVEAARHRQAERGGSGPGHAAPPAPAEPVTQQSLRTDLTMARDEIRRLRAERDKLLSRLRRQLGAEIEGPERAELIARVTTLETASRQLAAERDARTAEASHAQRQVRELQDELTAARESLRRVIRQANQ